MELTVKASDLQKEIQMVYGVIERKATIPILSNVLLKAKDNNLYLTATDIVVCINSSCPAVVMAEGSVTVSGQKIYESIRFLPPDGEIHIKLKENNWTHIDCEQTKYKIAGIGSDEFPTIQECDYSQAISMPWNVMSTMINKVLFAISSDDTRYAMRGALLIIDGEGVSLVSTDGHRLAYIHRKMKTTMKGNKMLKLIIPRKAMQELIKIGDDEQEIFISERENHVFFKIGTREIISSILEGEFPDFMKIVEDRGQVKLKLLTQLFMDAMKRVSPFSNEKLKGVSLSIEPGKLDVSASSAELGEAQETLQIDFKGNKTKISFNSRYIIEFLGAVGSEQIVMSLRDESSQGLFLPEPAGEFEYKYIVMPMSL